MTIIQVGERTHFCKLSSDLDEIISNRPGTSDSGISTFKPTSLRVYDDENESFNSESSSERRNLSSSEDSSLKTFSSSSSSSSLKRNKHLGIRKRRRQCNKVRQKWTKTAEIIVPGSQLLMTTNPVVPEEKKT
ncbi:hypothetical protein Avbf_01926 [Armadillidium vulgare]|nr:hypothetical protein Avbf_01926 [Armadillidium vulgare]